MVTAVGNASADADRRPGRGRRTPSSGWPCCCAPATSRSGSSPTAAGGRWSGRRAATRPAPPCGTPSLCSEEPETLRASSPCSTAAGSSAVAAEGQAPGAVAAQRRTPGRGHRAARRARSAQAVELLVDRARPSSTASRTATMPAPTSATTRSTRGAVTVMMRVVFLLFAEERRLLPSDDDLLRRRLLGRPPRRAAGAAGARALGEQTLEHRTAAWHRLLAVPAPCTAGSHHEDLTAARLRRRPVRPRPLPVARRPPTACRAPPGRRPHRAAHAPRGAVRASHRAASAAAHVPRPRRRADRLRLRGPARARGPPRHRGRGRPGRQAGPQRTRSTLSRRSRAPSRSKRSPDCTGRALQGRRESGRPRALAKRLARSTRRAEAARSVLGAAVRPTIRADRAARCRSTACSATDQRGLPVVILPGGAVRRPVHRRCAHTGTHYTPRSLAEEVVAARAGAAGLPRPARCRRRTERSGSCARPATSCSQLQGRRHRDGLRRVPRRRLPLPRRPPGRGVGPRRRHRSPAPSTPPHGRAAPTPKRPGRARGPPRRSSSTASTASTSTRWPSRWPSCRCGWSRWTRERPFTFLDDRLVAGDSLLGRHLAWSSSSRSTSTRRRAAACTTAPSTSPRKLARQARPGRRPPPPDHRHPRRHGPRRRTQGPAARRGGETVGEITTRRRRDHGRRPGATRSCKGKKLDAGVPGAVRLRSATKQRDTWPSRTSRRHLQDPRPAGTVEREPFHWPLAFPEIFADTPIARLRRHHRQPTVPRRQARSRALLGMTTSLGCSVGTATDVKGSADLAARFVLRADALLPATRPARLCNNQHPRRRATPCRSAWIRSQMADRRAARSPHPWPTKSANLQIVEFWASRHA